MCGTGNMSKKILKHFSDGVLALQIRAKSICFTIMNLLLVVCSQKVMDPRIHVKYTWIAKLTISSCCRLSCLISTLNTIFSV